jgi:mRNA interferase RelE/StbE
LSRYFIYVNPDTFNTVKELPGNIRQRVRQAIQDLAENPRPSKSKQLTVNIIEREVWRLRIDNWRIIYAIRDTEYTIGVIAVRKRPPYEYEDLQELLDLLELDE